MKIYFWSSISGGREYNEVYFIMIDYLKKFGKVLTEEVGDDKLIELTDRQLDDTKIYERDMKWLADSDIAIAEVSIPSLGVGYELANIEKMRKRHLCLYNQQSAKRLSSMINGNKFFNIKNYGNLEEALSHIGEFMKHL